MEREIPIRLAGLADATAIAAMSASEIEYGLPWRWTPPRIARAIRHASTNVAVVGPPQALVAFGIMSYADEVAHLQLFAVRAASRRRGVGSALLVWLEEVAWAAGIPTIRLEARYDSAAARAFYRSHGYRETGTVPGMYCGVADGVRLEKALLALSGSPR
jgi:ribosomal-protein-alanine N-acetyltransferase